MGRLPGLAQFGLVEIDHAVPGDLVIQIIQDRRAMRRHHHLLLRGYEGVEELHDLGIDPVLNLVEHQERVAILLQLGEDGDDHPVADVPGLGDQRPAIVGFLDLELLPSRRRAFVPTDLSRG